jgi:hypothetical protein
MAALVPPELVECEMIRVLACAVDKSVQREHRLRAVIRYLLAELIDLNNTTPQQRQRLHDAIQNILDELYRPDDTPSQLGRVLINRDCFGNR